MSNEKESHDGAGMSDINDELLARDALAPAVPEGWVACSERMPEDSSDVIASWSARGSPYDGHACVGTAVWTGKVWVCPLSYEELRQDVTHWMPLPAAPFAPPPSQQGE